MSDLDGERHLLRELAEARQQVAALRDALQEIIDCPDFSLRRAFAMKMTARAAIAKLPSETTKRLEGRSAVDEAERLSRDTEGAT